MTKKIYIRDGRAPVPKKEQTSITMSRIRAKNTKPEMHLRKALWVCGIRGYRLHWKKVPGRPDIAFPGKQLAIFVNGCYWHRCPKCNKELPKSNRTFWKEKFEMNIIRDKRKIKELNAAGWSTLTIWECELKEDRLKCVERVKGALKISAAKKLSRTNH